MRFLQGLSRVDPRCYVKLTEQGKARLGAVGRCSGHQFRGQAVLLKSLTAEAAKRARKAQKKGTE